VRPGAECRGDRGQGGGRGLAVHSGGANPDHQRAVMLAAHAGAASIAQMRVRRFVMPRCPLPALACRSGAANPGQAAASESWARCHGSRGDAGRPQDVEAVLGSDGGHSAWVGWDTRSRRQREGLGWLGAGAHEALKAGWLGHQQEPGTAC
jgi:hypothetical protein